MILTFLTFLCITACDATDPLNSAVGTAPTGPDIPAVSIFSKTTPVAFVEIDGPSFYSYFVPEFVSEEGVLFHSHKNCPGTPRNYSFPLGKPESLGGGLHRLIMACQYDYN